MRIGDFDTGRDVLVVAEVGNNHEGDYALAEELVGRAARAGAGAVKFQTIVPDRLVSAMQQERVRQLERFRLSREQFEGLADVARREGILFLSTPFDIESARFLGPLVPAFKIASGDNDFLPLIEAVARLDKPILLSSGFADLSHIRRAKEFIERVWRREGIRQELAILHCVGAYPTPPDQANLLAIRRLQELGVTVGYSDHTLGIEAAVLSVALGARIIEKHFTLDHDYSPFHDHRLSADPDQLERLVRRVKEADEMLGSGEKRLQDCEADGAIGARRSIAACRDLPSGTILGPDHITWVRPGGGLSPGREAEVLGRRLARPLRTGEMIRQADLVEPREEAV